MKKLLALVLAAVCLMSFASCSLFDMFKPDEERIIGKWKAEVDMTEAMSEMTDMMLGSMMPGDDADKYFEFDSLKFDMIIEFKEDGKMTSKFDKKSVEKAVDGLIEDMKNGLKAYYEDPANEGLLGDTDVSIDETLDAVFTEEYASAMVDSMTAEDHNGKYKLEGGKLYMAEEDEEFDDDDYIEYEFGFDTLVFKKAVGEDVEDIEEEGFLPEKIFPITFKKQ